MSFLGTIVKYLGLDTPVLDPLVDPKVGKFLQDSPERARLVTFFNQKAKEHNQPIVYKKFLGKGVYGNVACLRGPFGENGEVGDVAFKLMKKRGLLCHLRSREGNGLALQFNQHLPNIQVVAPQALITSRDSDQEIEILHRINIDEPRVILGVLSKPLSNSSSLLEIGVQRAFTSLEVKNYGFQLLHTLARLQDQKISLGDISWDNILIHESTAYIIDCDGFKHIGNERRNSILANPHFKAPEVDAYRSSYGLKADSFSLGIILYFMQAREVPFQFLNAIDNGSKKSINSYYKMANFDPDLRNLIIGLTHPEEGKRLSAEEALKSSYFRKSIH